MKINGKYTFYEFAAAMESGDFDNIDNSWLEWAEKTIPKFFEINYHYGDCTKTPMSCNLCLLESLLHEYYQYYFNEDKFREENGL